MLGEEYLYVSGLMRITEDIFALALGILFRDKQLPVLERMQEAETWQPSFTRVTWYSQRTWLVALKRRKRTKKLTLAKCREK